MVKQTKPFIIEVKTTRRMKSKPAETARSIWGDLAVNLKQTLAMEEEAPAASPVQPDCAEQPGGSSPTVADHGEATAVQPESQFFEKWISRKAERPKVGSQGEVATFLARLEQQKVLLAEFQSDPDGFKRWRSAWFRKVPDGFGVSVSHDRIDAGDGLRYVVVDTLDDVSRFLDDLRHHAQTDPDFQQALKASRMRRAARLAGGKAR
ncbi:MAG: hypothetical protein BGP09_23570 [Rhizobium sp. 60-20]|nr:hypothetical protein [Rhizobium tropici]OJY78893.1 MAG: hypothetical protein BGP09_23570 [Rhizobium sp. 60-20]